jgi:hypothetical protein
VPFDLTGPDEQQRAGLGLRQAVATMIEVD